MHYGMFKHAFSAEELYKGMNLKPLKKYKKIKKSLASDIFKDCFYEILLDIIDNNVTFVLPLKFGNYAEISMTQVRNEEFKKLYKLGKFSNIDYILSEFTGNEITFKYKTKTQGLKSKTIYLNGKLKEKIDYNTNKAKQYY